jgi:hypothetical protein
MSFPLPHALLSELTIFGVEFDTDIITIAKFTSDACSGTAAERVFKI